MGDFFKYTDKFFPDDPAFSFRFGHSGKPDVETILGINPDKIQVIRTIFAEHALHQIAFSLAQQPVVYEDAGKVPAYCTGEQDSGNGRVDTSRQGTEYLAVPYLFTDCLDLTLGKIIHFPVTGTAAHINHKMGQDLFSEFCVQNLRMVLDRVQIPLFALGRRYRTVVRVGSDLESGSQLRDIIVVAHPAGHGRREPLVQR